MKPKKILKKNKVNTGKPRKPELISQTRNLLNYRPGFN